MAEQVRRQGNWKRAGYLYLEVMIFDLQGVASGFGTNGFSRAYRSSTPAVAQEVARFSLHENVDREKLETVYDQVVDQFWIESFPRPTDEVWTELQQIVWEHRETIQLKKKVDHLGPDQLLPPEEAASFAKMSDDYDLLHRVGTLLEEESPTDIPWEKRKRAHMYLSAVDIDRIGKRWQGKAYRWAGQVVLSNDEKEAALTYFEKALSVADLDDRAAVKQMATTLRRERGR